MAAAKRRRRKGRRRRRRPRQEEPLPEAIRSLRAHRQEMFEQRPSPRPSALRAGWAKAQAAQQDRDRAAGWGASRTYQDRMGHRPGLIPPAEGEAPLWAHERLVASGVISQAPAASKEADDDDLQTQLQRLLWLAGETKRRLQRERRPTPYRPPTEPPVPRWLREREFNQRRQGVPPPQPLTVAAATAAAAPAPDLSPGHEPWTADTRDDAWVPAQSPSPFELPWSVASMAAGVAAAAISGGVELALAALRSAAPPPASDPDSDSDSASDSASASDDPVPQPQPRPRRPLKVRERKPPAQVREELSLPPFTGFEQAGSGLRPPSVPPPAASAFPVNPVPPPPSRGSGDATPRRPGSQRRRVRPRSPDKAATPAPAPAPTETLELDGTPCSPREYRYFEVFEDEATGAQLMLPRASPRRPRPRPPSPRNVYRRRASRPARRLAAPPACLLEPVASSAALAPSPVPEARPAAPAGPPAPAPAPAPTQVKVTTLAVPEVAGKPAHAAPAPSRAAPRPQPPSDAMLLELAKQLSPADFAGDMQWRAGIVAELRGALLSGRQVSDLTHHLLDRRMGRALEGRPRLQLGGMELRRPAGSLLP